jgi:hypothetical protein
LIMANTADLLALQTEYPTAFADPEATQQVTNTAEQISIIAGDALVTFGFNADKSDPNEETVVPVGEVNGTVLGEAIAAELEAMHPDQVRDFVEGHLRGETEQTGDEVSDYERCNVALLQLEYQPKVLRVVADLLENIAGLAAIQKQINNEPIRAALQKVANEGGLDHVFEGKVSKPAPITQYEVSAPVLIDLPETNARQGSEGCASGMCDL